MAVSLQLFPTLDKGVPLILSWYLFKFNCFVFGLITMYFVFVEFNDNLFAQNQLKRLFTSVSAFLYKKFTSGSETYSVVSSAKERIWLLLDLDMSFT